MEENKVILNMETLKHVFHALSWNPKEWTTKTAQILSPAYFPKDPINASTAIEKLKNKLSSIGINAREDMMFLVDSSSELGKEKIAVNIKQFNNALNPEKLEKLILFLEKIKKDWDELPTKYKDNRTDCHLGKASEKALECIESDTNQDNKTYVYWSS